MQSQTAAGTVDARDDYQWESAANGRIPAGAVPHGYEEDGQPLWVCRVRLHGGVHPGKVRPGLGLAGVPWDDAEIGVPGAYEVLVDRGIWGVASGGEVPADAYPAGRERTGEPLYVARAAVDGNNLQIGKIRPGFGAANIGYSNREIKVHAYEVLLRPQPATKAPAIPAPLTVTSEGLRVTVSVSIDLGGSR